MGNLKKNKGITFLIIGAIILNTAIFCSFLLSNNLPIFPYAKDPKITNNSIMDIKAATDFEYFRQFKVTENTGKNQTDVIIDPVTFSEEGKYCYKDSLRVYKSPYNPGDELISQVYNLVPNAYETFSTSPDFGDPSGWTVTEPLNTSIRVLPRFNGYKKVVEMFDNSSSDMVDMKNGFSNQVSGTAYVTLMTTTENTTFEFSINGASGYGVSLYFNQTGTICYASGGATFDSGIYYETNKWYTFKIDFDCSVNEYSVWYWDETSFSWVSIALDVNLYVYSATLYQTWIHSSLIKQALYIAALDYSWSSGYEEDRILYVSSANIAFIDNLTASETKDYRVYYNSTPTNPAGYTNIARTNYTVNFTDGGSVMMYVDDLELIRQFDKNGDERMSGDSFYKNTVTHEYDGGGGSVAAAPIISDGPIFIEAWHVDTASEWSFYRYYANSYIYKYHNYSGVGVYAWAVFGSGSGIATFDFEGTYFHQTGSWQYEEFDYTGGSWQSNLNVVDAGKMFQEETGDPNILITLWDMTPDPYLDDIMIREADFPEPASVGVTIGINSTYEPAVTHSMGAWQFYKDAGSTNINDKQDFVDNLHNSLIENPPTIGTLDSRNGTLILFKEFQVTENTGVNQTDVIIDPVIFTEEGKYCYKDSLRIYESPYSPGDELISQVYNIVPNANETFSNSSDFGDPSGWTITERSNTQIQVLPRFMGYKNVVECIDNSTTGDFCEMEKDFTAQVSGTYYITAMATIDTYHAIALVGSGGYAVCFGFYNTGNFYYSDGAAQDTGIAYETNKWYTFKCTFDCGTDKYNVWYWDENSLNWSVIGVNIDFVIPQTSVYREYLHTSGNFKAGIYVAATDNSWSSGYEEDEILYVSSANIAFIDSLSASETKSYRVYYNSTPTNPAGYTDISRTGYTVNFMDGGSAIMNIDNMAVLRQFDTDGNEHLGGGTRYQMGHVACNPFGNLYATPIINDGPIFIEAWQIADDNYWTYFRFYENSYIYRYQNYPGSGTCWFRGGFQAEDKIIDFDAQYYYTSGAWSSETFDYTGISWQDHYIVLDEGKMFTEDTGDSDTLITLWDMTPDPYLNDMRIRECEFPSNPLASISIAIGVESGNTAITNSFGFWQFYKDVGSTNVNDKQDFVDDLYDTLIANPPTINPLGPRCVFNDTEVPNILEVLQDPTSPGNLDIVNITVHITDNVSVHKVMINTNHSGSFVNYSMNFISGKVENGYWKYQIPQVAAGSIINYSIWVNDTSSNSNNTNSYQYLVVDNEDPNIGIVSRDPNSPSDLDLVNITVHVTDNVEVDTVLINSNHSGTPTNYEMDFLSGTTQDGYWNFTIPAYPIGTSIIYSIWVNDTNTNSDTVGPYQYIIGDNEVPDIISVSRDPLSPGNLNSVNITVHITDNEAVDTVLINSNHTGIPLDHEMDFLSGTFQDGYWNYTIPQGAAGTTINYSIWVNDTSDNPNTSISYQYLITDNEDPNIVGVSQDPLIPDNFDTVNITVHITDNVGINSVIINTNYTGSSQDYSMNFLSGTAQDSYWDYIIPQGSVGTTITYSIWTNDSNDNSDSVSGYQYQIILDDAPSIIDVSIDNNKPRPLDIINITAHVTDDQGISHVFLYTNLYGSFQYIEMNFISGSTTDGYWSFVSYVPLNASKKTINYSVWVNDTSGQIDISATYQFKVKKNPNPIIFIPPGEDITIIIIIIIGSIAASATVTATLLVKRRSTRVKTKRVMKTKVKKKVGIGAEEIRKVLRESDESLKLRKVSYEELKSMITSPISSISEEVYIRVQNLKSLTEQEKQLLLRDLVTLEEDEIEEWLTELEELEK